MTNRIELNWKLDGFVDEQRYYCSETVLDTNSLPIPKAVLAGDVRTYVDAAVEVGKTYYVAVGSMKNNIEKVSQVVSVVAVQITTVSLLHFENGFTDESGNVWQTFGTNPPRISTAQSKFGAQSLEVNVAQTDAANAGFETTLSQFPLDVDFTIEWFAFVRSWSEPQYQAYLNNGYNISGGLSLVTGLRDGKFALYSGTTKILIESTSGQLNVWEHHAITRKGNVIKKWRNGVEVGSGTYSGNIGLSNRTFCLGAYASDSGETGQMLNGFIDEFRILKGVSLYAANFTPPSTPF